MIVHFGQAALQLQWPRSVVAIGTFDGVHRGHQAVIGSAVNIARSRGIPACLVTFDRHPAAILAPERVPARLASLEDNLHAFEKLGVNLALVLPFDADLSRMSATRFLDEILRARLHAETLVIGHDFAFGNGREGNEAWLAAHIETHGVPPYTLDGKRVSSTSIRALLAEGAVEEAARQLGRPFSLSGVVVGGERLGRTLGYPTANLALSQALAVPADGVYAGEAETAAGTYGAAIAIGVRPAVGGGHRTIEAHLLDYSGPELYGQTLGLTFRSRLREERDFPTLDALVTQMDHDVSEVRRRLVETAP
jgi:riboflavin kinase/FMN adenylyltransferase